MTRSKRVIVCGGGAIGASIAYFLAVRGVSPVVIERHEVAGAASGKSGGFLARDWCRGSALDALARRSFDLHAELADALGNPWGYRRLDTYAGHASAHRHGTKRQPRPWLSDRVTLTGRIGSPRTTALVEPRKFTSGMIEAARALGAESHRGNVVSLLRDSGSAARGVVLEDGTTVDGDTVVIAMGPWSVLAARWLPLPAVFGLKGHSLIFDTGDAMPAEALFLEYQEVDGEVLTPEMFPRADGTTWVCAVSSTETLPLDPAQVQPDAGAHARLEEMCRNLSPILAAAPVIARQACFRPVTEDGLPLIGPVPGVEGAYVATGHSVWGILNAPATGEAMAGLILGGAPPSVDLSPFAVQRLPTLDPALLRTG